MLWSFLKDIYCRNTIKGKRNDLCIYLNEGTILCIKYTLKGVKNEVS